MCKEERPLSTVRFLGDALSLNPTTNPPIPEANQTDPPAPEANQTENGRTPEEVTVFHNIYTPILLRNGNSITGDDRNEMVLRSLPPVPEENLILARQYQERQDLEQSLRMQPAPTQMPWFLDEEHRVEEPEEYISDPGLPTENPPEISSDDSTSEFDLRVRLFETWGSSVGRNMERDILALNLLATVPGFRSENLDQLFDFGDTVQRDEGEVLERDEDEDAEEEME